MRKKMNLPVNSTRCHCEGCANHILGTFLPTLLLWAVAGPTYSAFHVQALP